MFVKEQLIEARELIEQKRYNEAKQLLRTIQHHKAREWLAQIDRMTHKVGIQQQLDEAKSLIKALRYNEARQFLNAIDHPAAQQMLDAIDDIEREKQRREARNTRNFRTAMGVICILTVATMLIFQGIGRVSTYDDGVIRVRYQFPWIQASLDHCPDQMCKIMLHNFFSRTSGIGILYRDLGFYIPNNQLHSYIYDEYASKHYIETESIDTYDWEYKGGPAVLVQYYINKTGRFYNTEIWFSEGKRLFGIVMVSANEAEYQRFKSEFDRVIESVEFLP